jgi:hypothetical protein
VLLLALLFGFTPADNWLLNQGEAMVMTKTLLLIEDNHHPTCGTDGV